MKAFLPLLLWPAALVAQPVAPDAGASVEGRADAPVRVVEYLSFTCPHCAEQEAAVGERLSALARAGTVVVETRHALRDPIDFGVAVVARCAGPATYPDNKRGLFAAQARWLPAAAEYLKANRARLATLPPADAYLSLLTGSGVMALLHERGLTDAAARACLSDPAETRALTAQATEAWSTRAIPGTPYTLVNGQPVDGHDWPALSAAIQAAADGSAPTPVVID